MDLAALLAFLFLFSVATLTDLGRVEGSIHTYDREPFKEVGNAFLLSGGSEGIVASDPAAPLSSSGIADGRSYIRNGGVPGDREPEGGGGGVPRGGAVQEEIGGATGGDSPSQGAAATEQAGGGGVQPGDGVRVDEAGEGEPARVQEDREDGDVRDGGDGLRGGPADEADDRGQEQGASHLGLPHRHVHRRQRSHQDRATGAISSATVSGPRHGHILDAVQRATHWELHRYNPRASNL